jgi:CRISPR-associated endoribonuclease Cas6
MPNAMVIPLQRMNEAPLPAAVGECTHGALFALLSEADPELARRLHGNADRKPFTLSAVREDRRGRPQMGKSAEVRLTFLDDDLFPLFAGALLRGALQTGLRIGQAQFMVTGLLTTEGTHPLAGHAAYGELAARARGAETLAIRFLSPTVFRSQGQDVLWPASRQVWQSWIRAWNAHALPSAPTGCGDGALAAEMLEEARLVELAATQVTVQRYQLETAHVSLATGGLIGFVGTCVYGLKALTDEDRRLLTLLADFAFYCGTGRKTTMGLGQTLRE